jgi:molybdopterin-binding protein
MKLSARNVLPGRIIAVTKGATRAHIKVELVPGLTMISSITNEAVDDLDLKVGDRRVGRDQVVRCHDREIGSAHIRSGEI